MLHTKIGSRLQVMPGARMFTIVVTRFSPFSTIATAISPNATMYESMPAFAVVASDGYPVHPVGMPPR